MQDILKINRAKWRTGGDWGNNRTGEGETSLLNEEGFMCCLGFRCNQLGIPKTVLLNVGTPEDIGWEEIPDLIKRMGEAKSNTKFCWQAMKINDAAKLRPETREKRLIKLFAKVKTKVVFFGKYKKKS